MASDRGEFQTLISLGGRQVTQVHPLLLAHDQSPRVLNADVRKTGRCRKRRGFVQHGITLGSPTGTGISGLHKWRGHPDLIATEGTRIYTVSGSSWTNRTPGGVSFSEGAARSVFASIKNIVVVVNPGISPLKWDGSAATFTALGGSPPSNAECVAQFRDWLFLANTPGNESRVYHCVVGNPEDWTTPNKAGNFDVRPDKKDKILQLVGGRHYLWVVKEDDIYLVNFEGANDFEVVPMGLGFGGVSRLGAIEYQGSLFFASKRGIFSLAQGGLTELTLGLQDDWESISNKSTVHLIADNRGILYAFYDSNGNGINDRALVINISDGLNSYWTPQPFRVATLDPATGNLYAGSETAPKLFKLNTGLNDDGVAISMERDTPSLLVRGGFERGRIYPQVVLAVRSFGDASSTIKLFVISNGVVSPTPYIFQMGGVDGEILRLVQRLPLDRHVVVGFRIVQDGLDDDAELVSLSLEAGLMEAPGKVGKEFVGGS